MTEPLRFLHAADLHLERPPRGLDEVPDHLRGLLVDAPFRAAERIFDTAIREHVDFVVLAGDVIDPPACGPRGLVFLADQFRKLADKGISVYWAGGRSDDCERWVEQWPLGDNVHRFSPHRAERIEHRRAGQSVAQVLGISTQQRKKIRASDFHTDGGPLFSVAVAYGVADPEALAQHTIRYWALGGEHDRRTLLAGPTTAHYCGTPQGRRPQESGPRGCTLVQVDETERVRASFIPTDAIRYLDEHVEVDASTTTTQLHQIIEERIGELLGDPFGPDLLVQWSISGGAGLTADLRHGKLAAELAARLRADHAQKRPAVWTTGIEPAGPSLPPEHLYDEETVLGEFLRSVRHYVEHPEDELSLEPYLTERHLAGSLGAAVRVNDPAVRRRVLEEVAGLGVELLGPQEHRT